MSPLYAHCPWGHRHEAVNVPDNPEAWLDFRCDVVACVSREEAKRRIAQMRSTPGGAAVAGQHFYVQVKDLVAE